MAPYTKNILSRRFVHKHIQCDREEVERTEPILRKLLREQGLPGLLKGYSRVTQGLLKGYSRAIQGFFKGYQGLSKGDYDLLKNRNIKFLCNVIWNICNSDIYTYCIV